DNHNVRILTESSAGPGGSVPVASEQFQKWYESRLPALANYEEYPVYIVAAQGGGIYAAYQTAIFLARLYDYCPAFNDYLFAVSSVSGGSLGAAAYVVAMQSLTEKPISSDLTQPNTLPPVSVGADPCPTITEYLRADLPLRRDLEAPGPLEIKMRK